jgi:hypothetical protein
LLAPVDKDGKLPLQEKEMTFGEAFNMGVMQVWSTVRLKGSNILYRSIYAATGISISFSRYERQVDENSARLRAFTRNYI